MLHPVNELVRERCDAFDCEGEVSEEIAEVRGGVHSADEEDRACVAVGVGHDGDEHPAV